MLLLGGEALDRGAACVLLRGPVGLRTVVSQGCRPVGRPLVVTKANETIILELGGQTPLQYLKGLLEELPAGDRELVQQGLLIGVAVSEYRDSFGRGDFVVRNLVGLDGKSGALALTDRVRVGQTVQFQVRDAASADADLATLLGSAKDAGAAPAGRWCSVATAGGRGCFRGRTTTPRR